MALLYIEGFEGLGTSTGNSGEDAVQDHVTQKYNGLFTQGDGPRIFEGWGGGYAFCFGNDLFGDANYIDFTVSDLTEVYVGFAYKPPTSPKSNNLILLRNAAENRNHLILHMSDGHALRVLRNFTVLGAVSGVLKPNRFVYIEFYGKIHDSTGAFEVRINGSTVLSRSNVDTNDGGDGTFSVVRLNGTDGDSDSASACALYDDVYICDANGSGPTNTFLGPIKVEGLLPDGDGDDTDFAPNEGEDNYATVDENPHDGDTSYVQASLTGDKDLYTFGSLQSIDGTIYGVQVNVVSKSTEGSVGYKIKAKHSTTEGESSEISQSSTNYVVDSAIFEKNPSTESAWTVSDVNAAQFGQEVV